ncbi:MAG: FecR domain-containing protein [Henriciella sp.]
MSKVHHIKPLEQIEEEAAAWVWKLDDERATPITQNAFKAWLAEDPRHLKVYKGLTETWEEFDDLAVLKHQFKLDTIMDGVQAEERKRFWSTPKMLIQAGMAAAVAIVTALSVGSHFLPARETPVDVSVATQLSYATAVGQQRQVTLEDKSTIELNTNTIVEVDYTDKHRLVRLEKGEAHFVVEKDANRPFIVAAGDTGVRAVGTAFNVYRASDAPVEVIVTEGAVDLVKAPAAEDFVAIFRARLKAQAAANAEPKREQMQMIRLSAGQTFKAPVGKVTFNANNDAPKPVFHLSRSAMERQLAWRQGRLVFEDERLEAVVNEFNRYSEARLVIADDKILDRQVGGNYKTGDVEGMLLELERRLNIHVARKKGKVFYLSDASTETSD